MVRMVSKATIVIITLFVAFLLYSVLNVLSAEHQSEDEIEVENIKIITENKVLYDDSVYWTGLPISSGNYFFVEPSDKTKRAYEEYKEELLGLIDNDTDEKMEAVYDKYYQIIGINGILDGVNDYEHELAHSSLVHYLGEYIYAKVKTSGNVTYGIELCSRNILSKAPLHGYVWSAINESSNIYLKGLSDEEKEISLSDPKFLQFLFNFVDTKLCYFKTVANMTKIYSSCLHGVGHGLSDVFGESRIKNAVEVCGMRDNFDFNYLCATGIFMDTAPKFTNFTPCDTNRYPAACFRFQSVQSQAIQKGDNISNVCSNFKERYMQIGCVWGFNYCDHKTFYTKAYDVCKEFEVEEIDGFLEPSVVGDPNDELKFKNRLYLACVDGFLNQSKIKKATDKNKKKTCKKFKNHKYIMDYCYEAAEPWKSIDSEDEDGDDWNFKLLEYDYNAKYDFKEVHFPDNLAMLLMKGAAKHEEAHQH